MPPLLPRDKHLLTEQAPAPDLLGLLVLGGLITGIVFINLYFGNEFAFLAWFNK